MALTHRLEDELILNFALVMINCPFISSD